MITVKDIMTDAQLTFDDDTVIDYALLYAQCIEDDNLARWFFQKVQGDELEDVKRLIRIWHGKSLFAAAIGFMYIEMD